MPPPRVLHLPPERPKPSGPPTSKLAVAALASAIVGWLALPVVGVVVALVCGHLALRELAERKESLKGRELAVAGLVLAYAQVAVVGLLAFGVCVFFAVTVLLVQLSGFAS